MESPSLPPELLVPPKRCIIRNRDCFYIGPVMLQILALFNPLLWMIPGIFSGHAQIDPYGSIGSQVVRMIVGWSCILIVLIVELVIWIGDFRNRQLAESGEAIIGEISSLSPGYGRAAHALVDCDGSERTIVITRAVYKLLKKERDQGARFEPILSHGRYTNFYRFHPYHCTLADQTS